jgi:hypothetical protein
MSAVRRRQSRGTVALLAAVTMLVAGCGGGGGGHNAATPAAASQPAPTRASFAAYRQCLAAHGITRPTDRPTAKPTPGAFRRHLDPARVQAFEAARQACGADRPAGGFRAGLFSHHERSGFRKCMADHGITLQRPARPTAGPGPTPTEERGGMLADLDRHNPKVAAALAACRAELLGNATPAPSPTS